MKLSLTFNVFNKEHYIEEYINLWLDSLSQNYSYEVLVNFDDLKDQSKDLTQKVLDKFIEQNPNLDISYKLFETPNLYELKCTNLLLKECTGDIIIIIQDDNFMYQKGWDVSVVNMYASTPNAGCIGMLAGVNVNYKTKSYSRLEILTPNKDPKCHNPISASLDQAYPVDTVIRPFIGLRSDFEELNYLDEAYAPFCWDDMDYCTKLARKGKQHYYIPFDLVNLSNNTTKETSGAGWANNIESRNGNIFWSRYSLS